MNIIVLVNIVVVSYIVVMYSIILLQQDIYAAIYVDNIQRIRCQEVLFSAQEWITRTHKMIIFINNSSINLSIWS